MGMLRDPHGVYFFPFLFFLFSVLVLIKHSISELNAERTRRQALEIKSVELEESLRYNTTHLTDQLRQYEAQPAIEDFDFLRSEVASLRANLDVDRRELEFLRNENKKLHESVEKPTQLRTLRTLSTNNTSRPTAHARHDNVNLRVEDENESELDHALNEDILKMTTKLKSLEKFANRFMPTTTHGVPEFHHTVEKSKNRMLDIEERLARRMHHRKRIRCVQ